MRDTTATPLLIPSSPVIRGNGDLSFHPKWTALAAYWPKGLVPCRSQMEASPKAKVFWQDLLEENKYAEDVTHFLSWITEIMLLTSTTTPDGDLHPGLWASVKIYLLQQFLSRWILFTGPDWWRSCLEETKLYGVYHHYRSLGTICNHFMIKINRSGVTQYKNLCSCRWSPTFNFLDYLSIHPSIPLHLKCKVNLESYSKITFKVISKRYASDWGWQSSHSLVLHHCDHNLLYSLCFAPYFSEKSIFFNSMC